MAEAGSAISAASVRAAAIVVHPSHHWSHHIHRQRSPAAGCGVQTRHRDSATQRHQHPLRQAMRRGNADGRRIAAPRLAQGCSSRVDQPWWCLYASHRGILGVVGLGHKPPPMRGWWRVAMARVFPEAARCIPVAIDPHSFCIYSLPDSRRSGKFCKLVRDYSLALTASISASRRCQSPSSTKPLMCRSTRSTKASGGMASSSHTPSPCAAL